MKLSTSGRIAALLAAGATAAALTASAATASPPRPPDVQDTAAAVVASAATPSRPPDVQDVADVIERYAAAHPHGVGLATVPARPPDVRDAAAAVRAATTQTTSSFRWGDYAAGIGTGIGCALIVAGLFAGVLLTRRHRVSTA